MNKNLKRGRGELNTRPFFYLFVEGQTEQVYFEKLRSSEYVRWHVNFKVVTCASPPSALVEGAIKWKKLTSIKSTDLIWCVFDVDKHPKLQEAISQAEQNGFKVAVSNPCFELWLSLHDKENNKRGTVSCGSLKSLKKSVLNGPYYSEDEIFWARGVASDLDVIHKDKRKFPDNNPSSTMPGLFKAIDEIKKQTQNSPR